MEKKTTGSSDAVVVFDSGIGGLNLLKACAVKAPQMHYYYFADNENVPYGNRSDEEIFSLVQTALSGIESLNPAALVVACNTVTARCIERLRAHYSFPVIGIQPAVKQAAVVGGRCLVLATQATVESQSFHTLVAKYSPPDTKIVALKDLAEYIENNIFCLPQRLPAGLLPDEKVNSVVLGCTHYAFISKQISEAYNCPVFDGIEGTAANFCRKCGISDHQAGFNGNFDHFCAKKLNLTFMRGNNIKNEQIFKYLFGN